MSAADDQLGGRGGPTGLDPARAEPGQDNAAPTDARPGRDPQPADRRPPDPDDEDRADESSRESFPASDPPGDY